MQAKAAVDDALSAHYSVRDKIHRHTMTQISLLGIAEKAIAIDCDGETYVSTTNQSASLARSGNYRPSTNS